MSEEQLKAFLEKVKADTSLQEKLKAAKSPEEVVDIGKQNGHEFTSEKLIQLSDEELESASGGGQVCLLSQNTQYSPMGCGITQAPASPCFFTKAGC